MKDAVVAHPKLIEKPAELAFALDLGFELEAMKEAGATFKLDELSEGAWCCLLGIQEGRARGEKERTK